MVSTLVLAFIIALVILSFNIPIIGPVIRFLVIAAILVLLISVFYNYQQIQKEKEQNTQQYIYK